MSLPARSTSKVSGIIVLSSLLYFGGAACHHGTWRTLEGHRAHKGLKMLSMGIVVAKEFKTHKWLTFLK